MTTKQKALEAMEEELAEMIYEWKFGAKINSSLAKDILAAGYRKRKFKTSKFPKRKSSHYQK